LKAAGVKAPAVFYVRQGVDDLDIAQWLIGLMRQSCYGWFSLQLCCQIFELD
jgi:hypothetical protein